MQRRTLRTFEEYLARAMSQPTLLRSPYSREQRRILTYMDWLRGHLASRAQRSESESSVSVVLPTFNRAHVLRRAVLSVLTQTLQRLQLVIVDDGSRDGTRELVNSFSDERITLVCLDANRGLPHARNVGLEAAVHEYVAFLDSDAWWDRDFLAIMLSEVERTGHRFAYAAQRALGPPDGEAQVGRRPEYILFAPYNAALLENRNYISTISVLHERSLALEAGGFDGNYKEFSDWDYFLRLAEASPPLGVPAVLAHQVLGTTGTVSTSEDRNHQVQLLRRGVSSRQIDLESLRMIPTGDVQQQSKQRSPSVGTVNAHSLASEDDRDLPDRHDLHALRVANDRARVMRFVTIVVPSFGVPQYLRMCLGSILRFTPPSRYEIIVVDNASGSEVHLALDDYEQLDHVQVIRNRRNLGFSRAVQQGIEAGRDDSDVVIINNDAVTTPDWLSALSTVAHRYSDAGLVAPRQALLPGDSGLKTHCPWAHPDVEADANLSGHHNNVIDPYFDTLENVIELDFVPFFCVLLRREVIEEIGPPTPEMGVHYQSDWVYSDAVRHMAGRRILHTARSKVYHFSGRATTELRSSDPTKFQVMGVDENWRAVQLDAL